MNKRKLILIIALSTILSACANHRQVLKDTKGNESLCHAEGYGIFPAMWAKEDFDNCVKQAQARGFK